MGWDRLSTEERVPAEKDERPEGKRPAHRIGRGSNSITGVGCHKGRVAAV